MTDIITAIGVLGTPVVVAVLGGIFLRYRLREERKWKVDEQLHPGRIEVYNEALDPYIVLLMPASEWAQFQRAYPEFKEMQQYEAALAQAKSLRYRRNSFKMMLIGSDEVVRAYNDLMLFHSRRRDAPMTEAESVDGLALFGELVLAIRRSVGNEATQLDAWDMLYWGWSNIEEIQAKHGS